MGMERGNPLPVGRYWVLLPLEHSIAFAYWKREVMTDIVMEREARQDDDWTLYVFRVVNPVVWHAETFGWPNHADATTLETWRPPSPTLPGRQRRVARWKLAETLFVGIGTIVVAGLIIQKFGNSRTGKGSDA